MANTFKFGNGNWAVKEDYALAYNDENGNFKPLPFDFTRASSATRVNKDGLIETVPSGKPRIDFTDNTSGHLMLEPTRTNFLTYSEEFESWSSGGSYVTANQAVSPDGKTTADELTKTGSFVQIQNTASVSSGADYVFSLFAKKNTTSYITMRIATGSNDVRRYINLDTNETGSSGGNNIGFTSTTIEDYSNGWKRISIRVTTGGTLAYCNLYAGQAGNTTYDGEVYIWGAQLEAGSYATSYIPTEGSSVTRSADAANSAGNSQVFDNDTGVWFIDLERIGIESGRAMMLANSSGGEQIRLHFDDPDEVIRFRDGKASFATIGGNISMGVGTRKKVALKIDGTTLKVFANGSQIGSNYTRPTAFDIHLMYAAEDAFKLFDTRFYNTALSDSELQALTS